MKHRVPKLEIKRNLAQDKLQPLLNQLEGEILAIVPNISPTFQLMRATSKLDFLLIVEKSGQWANPSSFASDQAPLGRSWQEDPPVSLVKDLGPGACARG